MKTRSTPGPKASADKERDNEPRTEALEPDGAESLPQASCSNILSIIEKDISTLSSEGKTIVSAIIKAMQSISDSKDQRIEQLETQVAVLEKKLTELDDKVDESSQYERRDTIIISGPVLPQEVNNERPSDVAVNAIKQNLHINVSPDDINIAHRIGKKSQTNNRPIIVKLHSRQKKYDIMNACITVKPNLYINESLTPKRLGLLNLLRNIRKNNRDLFQQLYTKDGTICVKLRCSNQKYFIYNEDTLNNFLDKFPVLKGLS